MELKPCPFCGSKDVAVHQEENADDELMYFVGCYGCNTCGPDDTKREKAVKMWNKAVRAGEGENK